MATSWKPIDLGGSTCAGEHGFSWGYLDVLDASHHTGVVVIWSFGLPFLPGTVGRARRGVPVNALQEPSISIAVYRRGRPDLWLLQRRRTDAATPEVSTGLAMEGCRFLVEPGRVEVELECPIPGGPPLTGRIELAGVPVSVEETGGSLHRWAPRLIGTGTVDLRCGDWSLKVEGTGYHDANASEVPLHALGIRRWIWGRTPHAGGTWVHYLIEPSDPAEAPRYLWLQIDLDGQVTRRDVEVRWGPERRGRWGLAAPSFFEIEGKRVEHVHAVEDGPYYQRWITEVEGCPGTGEVVDVDRMDAGLSSWLTPFAVHDPVCFSWWVPLFVGPPGTRWRRLWRHWSHWGLR